MCREVDVDVIMESDREERVKAMNSSDRIACAISIAHEQLRTVRHSSSARGQSYIHVILHSRGLAVSRYLVHEVPSIFSNETKIN
jgi:hypothetical protein